MADRCLACGETYEWCACAQWDGDEHDDLDSPIFGTTDG